MWSGSTRQCRTSSRTSPAGSRPVSDIRAQQAREHHQAVAATEDEAARHRRQRDELVRALRRDDPQRWSYAALAKAVGCSRELIAVIVKQNSGERKSAGHPRERIPGWPTVKEWT